MGLPSRRAEGAWSERRRVSCPPASSRCLSWMPPPQALPWSAPECPSLSGSWGLLGNITAQVLTGGSPSWPAACLQDLPCFSSLSLTLLLLPPPSHSLQPLLGPWTSQLLSCFWAWVLTVPCRQNAFPPTICDWLLLVRAVVTSGEASQLPSLRWPLPCYSVNPAYVKPCSEITCLA